jgi:cytidylate kinase
LPGKGNIAIDGPAGAGKSTVAKLVAEKLGYIYIDTGAMYRAITWKALVNKISVEDEIRMARLAQNTVIDFYVDIQTKKQLIFCDGQDVTEEIRSPEVSKLVSHVAKIPGVRLVLLKQQQLLATKNNVVMDGRDIGSNVLPNAPFKFFLTASVEERARRRFLELSNKGYKISQADVVTEIIERDKIDQERSVAPLVKTSDAIEIDTSFLKPVEVVNKIISIINRISESKTN